ncbi:thioredoxin domain-containing protein 5 homolog [Ischnura elegans]|uniref:thioredoxin domain-containing protein 5 homolog n=1 Tax=Ischnura elegans TaxID=197161 RepID=UPI001ED8BC33|nr:thioredoxin domain-containing protein 5 homolog [Ischnura elegans]
MSSFRVTLRVIAAAIIPTLACLAQDDGANTVQYSMENFYDEVAKKNHFVMFFAPWCGHCKRLHPTWDDLAKIYNVEDGLVTIGKVDCTVETELCAENDVTAYPTLKFFKVGEPDSTKFKGARDLDSLTSFVEEKLGKKAETEESSEAPKVPAPVTNVVELTEDSFGQHVKSGKHFIKFFAPWCGHCQRLAPTWDKLAESLSHDEGVSISKVDCTEHRSVCEDFEVKGYPTMLWIEDGKKVEKYTGSRTHEDLKDFVTRMMGRGDDKKEADAETPDVIGNLHGGNFENGISKGLAFVKFFAPWCGHCKRLAPTWDELGKKFVGSDLVKVFRVDCTLENSKSLCSKQGVDGYPSLFLYHNGKKVSEYDGARSLEDLYEFVVKNYPSHDEL